MAKDYQKYYIAMVHNGRKGFLLEMTAVYEEALGKKKYFTSRRETEVCYAFK